MISKTKTLLIIFLSWIIYFLSFLIPRKKNIWIFIGWRKNAEREIFGDNSKYLFLHAHNNLENIRAIWIAKDKKMASILTANGFESYSLKSFLGVYFSVRAEYTIADAFLSIGHWRLSGRSKFIQLWHGKGPKKIGYNSPYSLQKNIVMKKILQPQIFRRPIFSIAASEFTKQLLHSSFHFPLKDILVTGLPKYDVLSNKISGSEIDIHPELKKILLELKHKNYKKIILYAPTFRPDGTNPITQLNFKKLNKTLQQNNNFMILSLHPKFASKQWAPEEKFSNLDFIASGYDIYPLLSQFDLLITDYSSLSVDFLLLKKPTIHYICDINKYRDEMGLHKDFWELLPGIRVQTFDKLLDVLCEKTFVDSKKQNLAIKKLFDFTDGKASWRIAQAIIDTDSSIRRS